MICKAHKSLAAWKIREGMPLGCKVTLRGDRMYEFLDRLINIALPRVRDFRGISDQSFDGRGNYAFGVKEQLIFPEVDYEKIDRIRGMDIIVVTTAKTDENKWYKVAVNSYRGNGGGELLTRGAGIPKDSLESRIIWRSERDQRYYLMQEIEKMGTVDAKPNNNWRFVPEEWVKPAAERDFELLFKKK